MLQPGDKKALTIIGAVVVAAIVIIAGATTLLVRGHEKPWPTVSFQAGEDLSNVQASYWCSARGTECEGLNAEGNSTFLVTDHPVPIGSRATLSVPGEVAAGPWSLVAEYATPLGIQRVQWLHMPDTTYTQILESTPDRVLLGVEVGALAGVQVVGGGRASDAAADTLQGDIPYRGLFSIRTLPLNFKIKNQTPLTDERRN